MTDEIATGRDEVLGTALRALDVPEHGPGFDSELRRRLGRERVAGRERTLRGSRVLAGRRRWLAAVGAAAALALVAIALPSVLPGGPEAATAAEVRAAVSAALASTESLSGVLVNREQSGEVRWSFLMTARGDFRLTGITHPPDLAYDARENVERYSDEGYFTVRTGIAPGWPDSTASDWAVQRGLGSVVRALEAAGDTRVREIEYRSRPAWLLRAPTGNEHEEREITVDRQTGVPVRDVVFYRGRFVREFRIDRLRIDQEVAREPFELKPERGQQVTRYDAGFRRARLARVAELVGYDPLVPTWLPQGYELVEVAVALKSRRTGNEQRQNPPSRRVVSLAYRRGLDEVVVTTRLIGRDRSVWSNPVAAGLLSRRPQRVTFSGGALDGFRGELVIDPNSVPHLWAMTDRLVVTVAGDAERGELVRIAESLK